ncbi:MAG: TRAP transporter large permease [Planctomycetaceae bacterium]|nr:MAG: TRAP transporter large permease [Planctomycetaceae bacterium]
MTLLLLMLAMLVLLAIRVPVAFAMLLPCLVYVQFSDEITLGVALQRAVAGVDSFPLLAVPLFIMTGFLANAAGLADRLFRLLFWMLGRVPGSLAYVNVTSSVLFSWMSGAAIADAAGLGSVLVPAMRKSGYDAGFSLGLTGASSMIGPIMPPSIPAIIYAVTAGVSVGALFFAGVIPAIVLALTLCVHVFLHVRRHPPRKTAEGIGGAADSGWAAVTGALPVLFTPVIILGGILGGVFTPTEAAAAAVMYMLFLGVCYGTLSLAGLSDVLLRTATTTGVIMLIVAAASLFGWVIARERGPQMVADGLLRLTDNPYLFLLLVNLFLLVVGMLLEPTAALLICVPVLLPVALQFQVDPLHLGVVMILNLVIGLITPPIGLVLYVLGSVTGTPIATVIRGMVPFLWPLGFTLLVVTFVPAISLWLPRWLGI